MQTYWPGSWFKPVCLASLSVTLSGQSPVAEETLSFLNVENWSVSLFQGHSKQLLKEEGGQEQFHPGALWKKTEFWFTVALWWELNWSEGGARKKRAAGPFLVNLSPTRLA